MVFVLGLWHNINRQKIGMTESRQNQIPTQEKAEQQSCVNQLSQFDKYLKSANILALMFGLHCW